MAIRFLLYLHELGDDSLGNSGPFSPEMMPHHVSHRSDAAGGNGNLEEESGKQDADVNTTVPDIFLRSEPKHLTCLQQTEPHALAGEVCDKRGCHGNGALTLSAVALAIMLSVTASQYSLPHSLSGAAFTAMARAKLRP